MTVSQARPIQSIAVKLLRPTQIAVGKHLVKMKRKELRSLERKPQELVDSILSHPIRVVIGPRAAAYIIDHHHLGCALLKEGFLTAPVAIEADFSALTQAAFWRDMEKHAWVHPFDGHGRPHPVKDIPMVLEEMEDDPYRSLAGLVRRNGGFQKTLAPYSEFLWANYFRPLIRLKSPKPDFDSALKKALVLCAKPEAQQLPGFGAAAGRGNDATSGDTE
jgi:hypothetical protein